MDTEKHKENKKKITNIENRINVGRFAYLLAVIVIVIVVRRCCECWYSGSSRLSLL